MRLDPFIRDYPAFMDEFARVLTADGTYFYLDTSLLMWLIRLSAQARREFIAWCDGRPSGTVRVPVWAAHELHRHVIGGTIRANIQATLSETQAKYDEFVRLASERADEGGCLARGFAGRDGYANELTRSFERLRQLAQVVVDADGEQLQQSTDAVIEFVNQHVLESDIEPVVEKLSSTGDFRYAHFMPPGFQDKKDSNRYGDVIIWEELVKDILAAGPDADRNARHAVLVSRDKKTDWVSAAPLVRNLQGKTEKSNRDRELDVTLAHPLLVHEFAARAKGNKLYVIHPGFLASVIDHVARTKGQPSGVTKWLASSHRPDLLDGLAPLSLSRPAPAKAGGTRAAAHVPESPATRTIESEGLEGVSVNDVMTPPVSSEVRSYLEARPNEHANLVGAWVASFQDGSLTPFKIGRILADLVIAAAPGFTDHLTAILERLAGQVGQDALNRMTLAIVMSAYFDRYGVLLRRPHSGLGTIMLEYETDSRLAPAFSTTNRLLKSADAILPYVPGSGGKSVHFAIDIASSGTGPRLIRDIRVGEQSALDDQAPSDSRLLTTLLGHSPSAGCQGQELRALIAREYIIPMKRLRADNDGRKLTWAPTAGLVTLDTTSQGGLSTLGDEENGND